MSDATLERRVEVLRAVGAAERAAGLHPRWRARRFEVRGATAVARGARSFDGLPAQVRPRDREPARTARRAWVRSGADLVRFGKFDRDGTVRARAFRLGDDAWSLKLQTRRAAARHGLANEVRARLHVHELVPDLAPTLRAHRLDGDVVHLVEEVVTGDHASGREEVAARLPELVDGLTALYARGGYGRARLDEVLSPATPQRLAEAAAREPRLAALMPRIDGLLDEDRDLDVAFGHGDLVASNVLWADDGRMLLLDWEYARTLPVLSDLSKPFAQAADPARAAEVIRVGLGDRVGGSGAMPATSQLAVALLQNLSWYATRRAKAEQAGRMAAFRRDVRRRLTALEVLLASG